MIARSRLDDGQPLQGVAGTLMSNMGMEVALRDLGLEFVRAKVGDRYVMEQLTQRGWTLGGEGSGHVVCLDKTTTGDAIIASLQVLTAIVRSGLSLHELKQGMSKFPQQLINVRVGQKSDPMRNSLVSEAVAAVESELGGRGRVLLRASGTEPVIRVMVEGEHQAQISRLCQHLADVVRSALA
jgi:phosphoglucosamine mutase